MTALVAGTLPASAQAGEHRWGGLLFDAFAREASGGVEAWTAEDGGRIRHRDAVTGNWSFQAVPDEVRDTLHRVFFLPGTDTGWAVGQGGWVLKTTNGGTTWTTLGSRIAAPAGGDDPYEELFDIHFLTTSDGWMVGLHSIWSTGDGGLTWTNLGNPYDPVGQEFYNLHLDFVELYAIDVVQRPDGSRLGLISAQPGVVFRSTDANLATWELAWNITSLCASGGCGSVLAPCACDICPGGADHPGPWFEAWDIEISRHATQPLALVSGGVGSQCGMIFASTDDGVSWSKEWHECACPSGPACIDCSALPLYNDDPNDPNDLNRLQAFRTLYGLGIFDSDNSAVAAGYNGQHLVRDPATGVWLDRSVFATALPTTQGAVIFPLIGAEALTLTSGTKFAVISGMGGHLRESTDGGQTWGDKAVGEPNRIRDVFFKNTLLGWHVGQFFRIAITGNGGFTWDEQTPKPTATSHGFLQAVTFASAPEMYGVAVGDPFVPAGSNDSLPKILHTSTFQQMQPTQWLEAGQILGDAAFMNLKGLKDVAWAGGEEFWAVGEGGLILYSSNAGQAWRQKQPELSATLREFHMEGVSFRDTTTGLIVGRRITAGQPITADAHQYKIVGGTVTWTPLAMPAGMTVVALWGVAVSGSTAWIVGDQTVNGVLEGVVLSSTWINGNFGNLVDATPAGGIPQCVTGGNLEGVPVLSAVEVAPVTAETWVGGACGRLWVRSTSGVWSEVKSATDTHVLGMSFVPDGGTARGFIGGFRATQTQQCITSVE